MMSTVKVFPLLGSMPAWCMLYLFTTLLFSEPPRALNIIDSRGQELRTVAGPHAPGARIVLRCLSTGGRCELLQHKYNSLVENNVPFQMTIFVLSIQ